MTAPDLCLTCGASWACEHRYDPDTDPSLHRVEPDGTIYSRNPFVARATAPPLPADPLDDDTDDSAPGAAATTVLGSRVQFARQTAQTRSTVHVPWDAGPAVECPCGLNAPPFYVFAVFPPPYIPSRSTVTVPLTFQVAPAARTGRLEYWRDGTCPGCGRVYATERHDTPDFP